MSSQSNSIGPSQFQDIDFDFEELFQTNSVIPRVAFSVVHSVCNAAHLGWMLINWTLTVNNFFVDSEAEIVSTGSYIVQS